MNAHDSIVVATDILYGRKERNARSLDRDYMGDYCNLHQRPDLQRIIPRNEKIEFSSYLYKYDRRFRRQGRYFIATNQGLYIIDEECVRNSRNASPIDCWMKPFFSFGSRSKLEQEAKVKQRRKAKIRKVLS